MGHQWGCDLGVRYAVERPDAVLGVVGIDRVPEVHESLSASFTEWTHQPDLWRGLADCAVPMHFIAPGADIRPSWPPAQLAALVPRGRSSTVPDVPHDFWSTHPEVWTATVTDACAAW